MRIAENPIEASKIVQDARQRMDEANPRTGRHVSDLLYCSRKTWYREQQGGEGDMDDRKALTLMLGHGYEFLLGEDDTTQVEIEQDGITGTLDLVRSRTWHEKLGSGSQVTRSERWPVELKTTRYGLKWPVEHFQHWINQLATYAYLLGATRGSLVVIYIIPAVAKQWDFTWTKEELAAWWVELRGRATILEGAKHEGPDPQYRYSWECKYCPFYHNPCQPLAPALFDRPAFIDTEFDLLKGAIE